MDVSHLCNCPQFISNPNPNSDFHDWSECINLFGCQQVENLIFLSPLVDQRDIFCVREGPFLD